MKILLTTTSFQDTPGAHHDMLAKTGWEIIRARGPLNEADTLALVGDVDGYICGDDAITRKVLEKARPVQQRRVSVTLALFAQFTHPIRRFRGIQYSERTGRIKVGPPRVIDDSKVIALDANHHVGLTRRQIPVAWILLLQFDNHL